MPPFQTRDPAGEAYLQRESTLFDSAIRLSETKKKMQEVNSAASNKRTPRPEDEPLTDALLERIGWPAAGPLDREAAAGWSLVSLALLVILGLFSAGVVITTRRALLRSLTAWMGWLAAWAVWRWTRPAAGRDARGKPVQRVLELDHTSPVVAKGLGSQARLKRETPLTVSWTPPPNAKPPSAAVARLLASPTRAAAVASTPTRPLNLTNTAMTPVTTTTPGGSSASLFQLASGGFGYPPYAGATPQKPAAAPASSLVAPSRNLRLTSLVEEDAAYDYLENFHFDGLKVSTKMDEWTHRLKHVLSAHVRLALLQPLKEMNAKLGALRNPASGVQVFSDSLLNFELENEEISSSMTEASARAILSLFHLPEERIGLETLLAKRKELEKYLLFSRTVEGVKTAPFPASYVLRRLERLFSDRGLSRDYAWCSGASADDAPFDPTSQPTDAEIVFNVATCWFDSHLRKGADRRYGTTKHFNVIHVRDQPGEGQKEDALRAEGYWGFLTRHRHVAEDGLKVFRPHYKYVVAGRTRQVKSGARNLFHAVVMFLVELKKHNVQGGEALAGKILRAQPKEEDEDEDWERATLAF